MKALGGLPLLLLLTAICMAESSSTAQLQHDADQAKGSDCAKLSMQAARQLLEDAGHLFRNNNLKEGQAAIDGTVHYALRSVDCSIESHKWEKQDEIELRELIRRMDEIRKMLDIEDRPHVAESIVKMEKQRDRLLSAMFGPVVTGTEAKQ